MLNGRSPWQSFFLARQQINLSGPKSFSVQAMGSAAGAEIRYARVMVFRTDAFDSYEGSAYTGAEKTLTNTLTSLQFVTTAKPPSSRDYIVIQSNVVRATADPARARNVTC
jgi:hypothetical protein